MTQGKISSSKNRLFVAMLLAAVLVPLGVSLRAQDLEWAKRAGGIFPDEGRSIAVDGAGNSYVIGRFFDSATFGPGEANETTLTSEGSVDLFVAKMGMGCHAYFLGWFWIENPVTPHLSKEV